MTETNPASGETPTELLDGVLARVARVDVAADPPGNEWNFALGALFALCAMGHLDGPTTSRYEERIQAEATRIRAASGVTERPGAPGGTPGRSPAVGQEEGAQNT